MCAKLFGELEALAKDEGLVRGLGYETAVKPVLQCNIWILWVDEVHPKTQLTAVVRSLDCTVEFALVQKADTHVLQREKTKSLRYKISEGASLELIDAHQAVFDGIRGRFKDALTELRKSAAATAAKGEEAHEVLSGH